MPEQPTDHDSPARLVDVLDLEPHPEGGWFRRTWTSPVEAVPGRATASSILWLVEAPTRSRWHRIDATELWQHAAGAPLEVSTWAGSGEVSRSVLGSKVTGGETPQVVVAPSVWQSARSTGAWSLAVCVVSPEFAWDGFELAAEDWSPPG